MDEKSLYSFSSIIPLSDPPTIIHPGNDICSHFLAYSPCGEVIVPLMEYNSAGLIHDCSVVSRINLYRRASLLPIDSGNLEV